jgi:hypothetical protein
VKWADKAICPPAVLVVLQVKSEDLLAKVSSLQADLKAANKENETPQKAVLGNN